MKNRNLSPPLASAFVTLFIAIVNASTDFTQCCTRVPVPADLKPLHWDACHSTYNQSEINPLRRFAPPILATLEWCQQNCEYTGIFFINETSQWLTPFASWVIPATAMLFLCPISEHLLPPRETSCWREWLDEFVFNWLDTVLEYMKIIGDPASALNGALAQMMNDVTLCMCLKRPENNHRERALIATVILAEQVDIETPIVRTTFQILSGLDKAQEYSKTACRTMMAARKKFHMSVTLPVIFYIGVAAAIFYDAHGKLGDNNTSYSLAYGIWYNWIILLSIFANCAASHISPEAIRSSLETIIRGVVENHTWVETENLGWDKSIGPARPLYELAASSIISQKHVPLPSPCPNTLKGTRALKYQGTIEVKALPLTDRYFNALKWNKWLFDRGVDVCRPTRGVWRFQLFWHDHWTKPHPMRRYWICQSLAWLFVLFPCLCAAFVSFTTPKVALGCRSFNHLLYAVLTLVTASVRVLVSGIDKKRTYLLQAVNCAHQALIWFNAVVVLIGGTVLQLVGAFNTCRCAAGLFAGPAAVISMGTNTSVDQFWAQAVWLNLGYIAYGWIVVVALCALAVRLYISYTIRDELDI